MIKPTQDERKKFNVYYPRDTEFSAYARLLQSKWRASKDLSEFKLGSFLDIDDAKSKKTNFLTDKIGQLVTEEIVKVRQAGGLIGEPRIWNNLLSSQPLCFNLFGELHYDLDLATKFFQRLFPDRIDSVTSIKFEYSPGRGDSKYLGDNSAFDVFVEYKKASNKGFIGIEVKYAESLKEESKNKANKNFKDRYVTLTNISNRFKPNSVDFLRQPPLSQIWRDHLLCIATQQDYHEGFFVFLFPSQNSQCQDGVDCYKKYLSSENEKESCFYSRHLEEFINALQTISTADWIKELKLRYLGNEG